ncbi:hypothetical protein FEM33_01670 [Dyadobacter flavalbus]|uniref:DUF3168 domain-containing protein n=1 Tax=Dyadobacter flavalbus TaxID=2579942 RepID=A0A5M8QZ38_9BACT|nr:hypothetical protein [Dyadobacter flavalbus]KAA6441469.1 hypothetical protein FEM33_01670 [Dyadobacter flavalbus]
MRTTAEAETIVYQFIKASALDEAVTGGVFKWKRPNDSKLEDIVINSLPVTVNSIQRMTVNVNIYVADVPYPGLNFTTQDSGRIEELAGIAMNLFEEVQGQYYDFRVETQSIFEEPDIDQHYINFRLQFQFYETD